VVLKKRMSRFGMMVSGGFGVYLFGEMWIVAVSSRESMRAFC
jgi:hypothetical protein